MQLQERSALHFKVSEFVFNAFLSMSRYFTRVIFSLRDVSDHPSLLKCNHLIHVPVSRIHTFACWRCAALRPNKVEDPKRYDT